MNKKSLIINLIGLFVLLFAIILLPIEFIRARRLFYAAMTCAAMALIIINYLNTRKAKISWIEPKSNVRARQKEKIKSEIRRTSWIWISFWLFIVLPLCVYVLEKAHPGFRFRWYFVPLIVPFTVLFWLYWSALEYYGGKSRIIMDDQGIRLNGSDGRLRKYLYNKMSDMEVITSAAGNALSWQYEGKQIIRTISPETEISKIKALIETSSELKVAIKEALTTGSTADRD